MSACPPIRLARLWYQRMCSVEPQHAAALHAAALHIRLQYVVQQRILRDVLLTCNFREGGDLRA